MHWSRSLGTKPHLPFLRHPLLPSTQLHNHHGLGRKRGRGFREGFFICQQLVLSYSILLIEHKTLGLLLALSQKMLGLNDVLATNPWLREERTPNRTGSRVGRNGLVESPDLGGRQTWLWIPSCYFYASVFDKISYLFFILLSPFLSIGIIVLTKKFGWRLKEIIM